METERWSSSDSQPAANGSDAPTSSSPTAILAGKPTAKTLSCGTTFETTPIATSVMISASSTGAQTWIADAKMPLNASWAAAVIESSWGQASSGTAS